MASGGASGRTRRRPSGGPAPTRRRENELAADGAIVCGIDEVGRGAWAGPLSVGVTVFRPDVVVKGIRDSKALRSDVRADVAARIRDRLPYGIGHVEPAALDVLGMTAGLRLAVLRALDDLAARSGIRPDVALLDGTHNFLRGVLDVQCAVKADRHCVSVAAASVVAKEARDDLMRAAAADFPAYDFAANVGYPAPAHTAALRAVGPCALHRRSWAPIRDLLGLGAPERGCVTAARDVQLGLW